MTSEYNKLMFTSENTDPDLINYYMANEDKAHPFIKYLPDEAISQNIISPPIYQEIHTGYNPLCKSEKSLNIPNKKYANFNSSKSQNSNIDFIDCEISLEDDYNHNSNNNRNIKNNFNISKSPTSQKSINPINLKYNSLSIINEKINHNRARSPKIVRKNNFNLNDSYAFEDNNDYSNNDIISKSKSMNKYYTRSPCPSPTKQNNNNNDYNFQMLKDSSSSNNIDPLKTVQYQYNFNPLKINSNNMQRQQISMSPQRNQNNLLLNLRNKKTLENSENRGSYSTMISRSPNSINSTKYFNTLTSGKISPFYITSNMDEINNLLYLNPNSNIVNYQNQYVNPISNNLSSNFNVPVNYFNNNVYNRSRVSSFNNGINTLNNNIFSYSPKYYRPKFHNKYKSSYKSIPISKEYIKPNLTSQSPKKVSNFTNMQNKSQNSNDTNRIIFQYNYANSLSPRNNQNNTVNNNNISPRNNYNNLKRTQSSHQYIPNIKSSLPRISDFSGNIPKSEFFSNNITELSFGGKNINNLGPINFNQGLTTENKNKILFQKELNLKQINENIKENDIISSNNLKNDKNYIEKKRSLSDLNDNDFPTDYFSQYMFNHINKLRTNPQYFIKDLRNSINKIARNKTGKLYYNGKIKVALYEGKRVFEEAISYLEKTKPMNPLIFKKELCVEISKKEKYFNSGDYLKKKIYKIISKGMTVRAFWRDIIKDPEINFLLMVVDDNYIRKGAKRKDILNPEMKYIGINSGSIGKSFVSYTVLSDE